jgi:opacity protein-like surface antigen
MNRIAFGIAALALGVTAGTSRSAAQRPYESGSTRPISIGLGGGVSVPVSDYKESFKNGFNGFNLRGLPIAPRLDFTFQKLNIKETQLSGTGFTGGKSQILSGLGNLTYSLGVGPIRPYILAGLGVYNLKTEVESESAGTEPEASNTQTKFGINGGAGLLLKLGGISAYIEGRIDNIFTQENQNVGQNIKSVKIVPVTFGLVF